ISSSLGGGVPSTYPKAHPLAVSSGRQYALGPRVAKRAARGLRCVGLGGSRCAGRRIFHNAINISTAAKNSHASHESCAKLHACESYWYSFGWSNPTSARDAPAH